MDDNNRNQINLKDMVQYCRDTVDNLNNNTLVAVLREQDENYGKALDLIERLLPAAENVLDQDTKEVSIRAATMFLIGLWSKLKQGDSVSDLTKDEWNNILGNAYEQAAVIDPKDYSLKVFDLYRRSIEFAIEPMRANASPAAVERLEEIVSLMGEYAKDLEEGAMPETKYIEENLWLSLEAVFTVMTDRLNFRLVSEEKRELAEAVGALAFQRLRLSIYEKELDAINECLDQQSQLDQKLTEQVNAYIDALRDELDEFDALVEKAFDTADFQSAFRGSIDLAKMIGTEEILRTQQDIDDYFLS